MDANSPAVPTAAKSPGILNTLLGSGIAAGLGYLFSLLLRSVIEKLPAVNPDAAPFARSISVVIRYVIVGSVSLMTFFFVAIGLGLLAYAAQLLLEKFSKPQLSQ